jgi:hypothetical protein
MFRLILKLEILLVLCALIISMQCLCDDDDSPSGPVTPPSLAHRYSPSRIVLDTAFAGGVDAEAIVEIENLTDNDLLLDSLMNVRCPEGVSWSPSSGWLRPTLSVTFRFEPDQAFARDSCSFLASVNDFIPAGDPSLKVIFAAGAATCSLTPSAEFLFPETLIGQAADLTLTLSNTTPDAISANRFRYWFHDPSADCDLFLLDPADSVAVLGPGESRDLAVTFQPDAAGEFQCRRTLSTLRGVDEEEPLSPAHSCPSEIVWTGTGIAPTSPWSACYRDGTNDWHGVFGFSGSEIFVAGAAGTVLSSGGDCRWVPSGTGFTTLNLKDVWGDGVGTDRVLYAVGNSLPEPGGPGAILRFEEGAWGKVDEDGFHTYFAVWGSGPDDIYFAGTGIASDFPNAKYWDGSTLDTLTISDSGMDPVTGLSGTGTDDVWAVMELSTNSVLRFQGERWEDETQPFMAEPLHDVWAIQGEGFYAVYAVGENGSIYHYDGATGWSDESIAGESRDFHGVWVGATGQVFVVGEGHVIYRGHVTDPTWTLQNPPADLPSGDLLDVWGAADGGVYAVGTNGVILRNETGG